MEPEGPQRFTVVALDLGIKTNTPRNFALRGIRTHVLPSSAGFEQIADIKPDGVFLSNGPGDPATADHVVAVTRDVLGAGIPLFGICFGNQILGRALGRSTYKMVFGHRGINVPVIDHATGCVAITAQNHGFALEGEAGERFDTDFGPAVVSHLRQRRRRGGHQTRRRQRLLGAVPPGGRRRPARRQLPVRPVRRADGGKK